MELMGVRESVKFYRDKIGLENIIDKGEFIGGEEVEKFEYELADFCGVEYCVSCGSGTDALLLALKTLEIPKERDIFVTPFSFIASADVIARIGCRPVFVDIDPDTWNMDLDALEFILRLGDQINVKGSAVIAVDIFGNPCDYGKLKCICEKYGIALIADAAQSMGGSQGEKKVGNLCEISATSFFPTKPLGGWGDGGAVLCQSAEMAKKIRSLAHHGKKEDGRYSDIGLNSRLDTFQAYILREKLKVLKAEIKSRNKAASEYIERLKGVQFQKIEKDSVSARAIFGIRSKHREVIAKALADKNIPTGRYYPRGIHQNPVWEKLGYRKVRRPVCEELCKSILCLPMHAFLKMEGIESICEIINQVTV